MKILVIVGHLAVIASMASCGSAPVGALTSALGGGGVKDAGSDAGRAGCIWIRGTDLGKKYQYCDDYDQDGIEDPFDDDLGVLIPGEEDGGR
jgi:hypothetical protein